MLVLDTDTLTHLVRGHPRVVERALHITSDLNLISVSQMEQLRGRFDAVFKAEDGQALLQAQQRLIETEGELGKLPILWIDTAAAAEFDRLRANRKLKKIGRGDMLIAAITLANQATLITHNLKDFRLVPGLKIENWVD